MIEVGLTLALHLAGLGAAVAVLAWIARHDAGGPDGRRVVNAVRRAMRAFMWAEFRVVALGVLAVAALVFPVACYFGASAGPLGRVPCAVGSLVMICAGALTTSVLAAWSIDASLAASARVAATTGVSLDRMLVLAVRTGGAGGLLCETLSFALVGGSYAVLMSFSGAFALSTEQALPIATQVAALVPSAALGAAVAALVLQRGGAIFHVASDFGGDTAFQIDASVRADDPRNPAVISQLVGDQVGLTTSRCVDFFVGSTIANAVLLVVATSVFVAKPEAPVLGAAVLPFLVRAFGVVASAFGIMVVRTEESGRAEAGLWRGHATASIIAFGGLSSASLWLLEPATATAFICAGTLGSLGALGAAHLTGLLTRRGLKREPRLAESLRVGGASTLSHGLGAGLQVALLPTVFFGLFLIAAWRLGEVSGMPQGGLLATLTALAAMLATSSYVAALGSLGPIANTARGIAAVSRTSSDQALRRLTHLQKGGHSASTVAQNYMILTGCLAALGSAAAASLLSDTTALSRAGGLGLYGTDPLVIWSGALGAVAVLAYAGNAAQAAARGANDVAGEVERQLGGFPREGGQTRVPVDHTPNYRACIDLSSRHGLGRLLLPIGVGLTFPVLLGVVLGILYRSVAPVAATEALVAYVTVGALTGLGAALTADSMPGSLEFVRHRAPPNDSPRAQSASAGNSAVGDVLANALGPAAQLLAKAGAATTLAIAPFLR